jgi:hypothetical protein
VVVGTVLVGLSNKSGIDVAFLLLLLAVLPKEDMEERLLNVDGFVPLLASELAPLVVGFDSDAIFFILIFIE